MRTIRMCTLMLVVAWAATGVMADVNLVSNGRSDYRIVLGKNASASEHRAAVELKEFIDEMTGARMPIVDDDGVAPDKAVLIGDSESLRALDPGIDVASMEPEGYVIKTSGSRLIIAGGRRRGTMYGVYAFLEDRLGCRWYSSKVSKMPRKNSIVIKDLNITGSPAFEYREVFYTDAFDKDWAARNRINGDHARLDSETGGKIAYYQFVHSFAPLVPLEKYWDSHPEYYSMIDGKRIKDQTQLCMTNPDVVRVATQQVLEWMREHPEASIYSVSQNDWYNNCQCDNCRAVDAEEGSPSGLMLRFVNAIAEVTEKTYPDKLIDTLAYQWTEKPPKTTRPRHNVRARLCPIFCCEAHPYEKCDAKENVAYIENLRNWAKITDNLYIWHYNTSFSHYLNPFPDFRQLADSAKLYKKSGVKGLFWQGNYSLGGGGELAELRAYMLAKISWDPEVDAVAVMKDFVDGYYGASGKYIWDYIRLMGDKVTSENIHFHIWASPTDAFLSADIVAKSDALLSRAEAAAESDEVRERVMRARLPMEYVKLMQPILAKQTAGREAELLGKLDKFVGECKRHGITNISEGMSIEYFHSHLHKQLSGQ